MTLKAPFVWFGGKRRVAPLVWAEMGDAEQYVEPFFGSGAVLLGRPREHSPKAETVNDADGYLANFWRAIRGDPDAVAVHADWPVNEVDLFARHLWLVNEGKARLIAGLEADPEWFDPKIAGWWVWGINAWIGSGWCSGVGPWISDEGDEPENRKRPHLGDAGRGVNRQLPHLGDAGRGVNRQLPHLGDAGRGALHLYFAQVAARLRKVRVCCGDWSRVCTRGAMNYGTTVGVFLDPPYSGEVRTENLYASDDHDIAAGVRDWAIANGNDPRLRIVLAGYEAEHVDHMPSDWRMFAYSASKAYGTHDQADDEGNGVNRHQERLWYSPHCLNPVDTLWNHPAQLLKESSAGDAL